LIEIRIEGLGTAPSNAYLMNPINWEASNKPDQGAIGKEG